MRKSSFLTGLAAIAGVMMGIGTANAADLPLKARAMAPAPVFSWSGFYVGANFGGGWTTSDVGLVSSDFFGPGGVGGPDGQATLNRDGSNRFRNFGLLGGLQAGYNWQAGSFLFGLEGSIDALHFDESFDTGIRPTPPLSPGLGLYQFSGQSRTNWLATLGPRVGVISGPWLAYATGGGAFGDVALRTTSGPFAGCGGCFVTTDTSQIRTGWFAGLGAEYALNAYLTVKGEYIHADLGTLSYSDNLAAGGFPTAAFAHSDKVTDDIIRVGFNVKLQGPVVAKY